jgi:oligosaccharide repeat unit polymerase
MLSIQLIPYLIDDSYLYLTVLAFCMAIYWCLLRKFIFSIFDPLFVLTIFSCFGGAVVIFMFWLQIIEYKYFLSYILTQIAFILGVRVFKPINVDKLILLKPVKRDSENTSLLLVLYILVSLIYISTQIITYMIAGVPLFQQSRLDFFVSDSGFGLFSRVIYSTSLATMFLLMYRFEKWNGNVYAKMYDIFVLINIIINATLSGSKSSMLILLSITFYYGLFSIRKNGNLLFFNKVKKYQYIITGMAVVVAVAVSLIQDSSSYGQNIGLLSFLNRLILSGDVFINAYPNSVIENMEWHNPLLVIFQDFLGLFRLISWQDAPTTLGIELYRYFDPAAATVGPNPRHNVFGYVYFGYVGSLFYSFLIGAILSFTRTKLFLSTKPTIIRGMLYMLIAFPTTGIEADIGSVIAYIDNAIFIVFPLIIFAHIIVTAASNNIGLINKN